MDKSEVTSHDQKGGITAQEVHIGDKSESTSLDSSKGLPKWILWLAAIAPIIATIIAAINYFN